MGSYCAIGSVKGQLLPVPTLKGKLSIPPYSLCEHEEFDGEYTVTPGDAQIVLATAGKLLTHDIVVEPSPGVMPPGSSMATDDDIDNLIDEIFGGESEMPNPNPDEPTYNEDDIATKEEFEDVLKDVFG